jgi:phosphomevalonate kinase
MRKNSRSAIPVIYIFATIAPVPVYHHPIASAPPETQMTTPSEMVVVSAPGKMLLAGGYLVLEEGNVGLVVGVNARLYCSCERLVPSNDSSIRDIHVTSPQFGTEWQYLWNHAQQSFVSSSDDASSNVTTTNPFLEKAIRVALLYIGSSLSSDLRLHIVGDNDFYSLRPHLQARGLPSTLESIAQLPLRLPVRQDPTTNNIYKTGLGSSACLVTAVTGALLHAHTSSDDTTNSSIDRRIAIERLAHIGHCYAQGKVGSGFDVSAAIHGSHVYQRFPPQILADLLRRLDGDASDVTTTATALRDVVHTDALWAGVVQPLYCFASASFLQVIMADVSGGSESPSMAKQVLLWRAQFKDAPVPHWDDLQRVNCAIVDALQEIHALAPTADPELQQPFLDTPPVLWATCLGTHLAVKLSELRHLILQARHHLKEMGQAAGNVPIEPDAQTDLCDAVMDRVPGVVAALVPGAGGLDAVACIYINSPTVRRAVADFWGLEWTATQVCALTVEGVAFGDGLRVEEAFPSFFPA